MTRRSAGLRYLAALVAIFGLAVFDVGRAVAQEGVASEEVVASEEIVAPAEEPSADWVAVACEPVPDAGMTACVFSVSLASGAAAEALTVRFDQVCGAEVIDAGGAALVDAGYRAAAPAVSLLLTGVFGVSGDLTTYAVESAGVAAEVAGNALACAPPPPPDPPAPTTADVLVNAYYCPTGAGDVASGVLPADCYGAAGIAFTAAADGADLGAFVADETGAAVVTAPLGATLTLSEDPTTIAAGFGPLGDGTASVAPVAEGAAASLIHVPVEGGGGEEPPPAPEPGETDGETTGRLQLVRGTCSTVGDPRTELTVIGPNTFQVQAQEDSGCQAAAAATFLLTGGALPPEGETKVTEDDGAWRGTLLPGLYTVLDIASGQSVDIEVVPDGVVVVVAMEYIPFEETGRIAVRRYACVDPDLDAPTTAIETVFNPPDEPSAGDESCVAEDGLFQLNDGDPFDGGGDGAISFDLPIGSYLFTDLDSDSTVEVGVENAATTYVVVRRWLPEGELAVFYAFCAAANAHTVSPTDADYFAENCSATAGVELMLIDAAGNVVGTAITDANGIARWSNLPAGTYLIRGVGDRATCAVFVAQVPALGGFSVLANTIYQGAVFGCIKPAPGDGSGGGNNGGNNGGNSGGDGTGGAPDPGPVTGGDTGTNAGPYVTTLPVTGVAGASEQSGLPVGLLAAGLAAVVLAAWVGRWTAAPAVVPALRRRDVRGPGIEIPG